MTRKQNILFAFVIPALVAMAAVWLLVGRWHEQLAIERWSSDHRALVESIARVTRQELAEGEELLAFTARLPEFSSLSAVDRVHPALNGIPGDVEVGKRRVLDALLAGADHHIAVAAVLLPNGDHYLAHPYKVQQSLRKYNLADRPYFQDATRTRSKTVSDSIIGADGVPAVVIDIPLLNREGELFAHLAGVVPLGHLSKILGRAQIAPFDHAMLVDGQGLLIGHSLGEAAGDAVERRKVAHPLLEKMLTSGQRTEFAVWSEAPGSEWLGFAHRLDSGWTLILSRRLDEVMAEYASATQQTTALVAVILLLTGSIGLIIAMRVTRLWEAADQELLAARDGLEKRVAERTADLTASREKLRRSNDFYLTVLEHFPAMIWRSGLDARCDYFNATWLEFRGRSLAQEVGEGWVEGVHPEDRERCVSAYLQDFEARLAFSVEYRLQRRDGQYRWIVVVGRPFFDLDGQFAGYLGACFDVSERHDAAEQLRLTASVFSHAREGILITDASGIIVDVNAAFTTITGYSRADALGQTPAILMAGHQSQECYDAMWATVKQSGDWQGEIWNRKKNGELYAELLTFSAVPGEDERTGHYLGIFADITLQKEHEKRLEKLAHFDPLTDLPNRTLLNDRLHMSIAAARRNQTRLAICLLDLDGFKAVNDHFGHAFGDRLLVEFAQRAVAILRGTDTIARLGGDEFVVLLNDLTDIEQGLEVIARVLDEARRTYDVGGEMIVVSGSAGITVFPDDGADPEVLLRHADQAMYRAKREGRNRYFLFDPLRAAE